LKVNRDPGDTSGDVDAAIAANRVGLMEFDLTAWTAYSFA
jgi:hypothetical protein